jgi:hypothetical protein
MQLGAGGRAVIFVITWIALPATIAAFLLVCC